MQLQEVKEALAQGKEATRSTWEKGTKISQIPETDKYVLTLADGSKEEYGFSMYDAHELDWSLIESEKIEPIKEKLIP
jgi:hypothetical protein